ncbi:MAG: enoyl-CoA hydratase/isomerase family protein [Chloroflexi bacterium]|nr:enoyl-CoA hydratase/isomerase family protein [Chloroflexota bacterium]
MSVTLDAAGPIAALAVDPPADGYDRALTEGLTAAAAELTARHPEVRVVVVGTAGAGFGRGWSPAAIEDDAMLRDILGPIGAGFDALAGVPQPTVAAIRGAAHSAGLELALACDIRVAADDATFAMPETGAGLVPRGGGTQRLPRAVGRAQALRLLLTGEEIDAAEALRIGLVSEVVADGDLDAAASAVAEAIASRGPLATRFAKEAIMRGVEAPLAEALRLELELTVLLQTTADRAEGVNAFVERRDPEFTGE